MHKNSSRDLKPAGGDVKVKEIFEQGPNLEVHLFERSRSSQDRRKLDTLYERAMEQDMQPNEFEKRAYDLGMRQLEFEGMAEAIRQKVASYKEAFLERRRM